MNTINNYKICYSLLDMICQNKGEKIIDFPVLIDTDQPDVSIENNIITVPKSKNWAQTNFYILSVYLCNFNKIYKKEILTAEEYNNYITIVSAIFRKIYYDDKDYQFSPTKTSIYNYPLVWNLMKDIICPIFETNCKCCSIYEVDNPYIDIALFVPKNDIILEDYIVLNNIGDKLIKNACILIEAIKGHQLIPSQVIKEILNSEIYEQFYGCLLLYLNKQESDFFINYLLDFMDESSLDIIGIKRSYSGKYIKKAQVQFPETGNQFWYLGLPEEMIAPFRGPSFDVYNSLEKPVREFWEYVEQIKKTQGKKDLPFDQLLATMNQVLQEKTPDNEILQKLLSSDRVW